MTNRTVAVSLTAQVSNYVSGFEQVNRKNKEVTASSEAARQKFEDQNAAMGKIGAGVTAFGAIAAVAVGIAVAKFAEFDAAMSNVEAATHESAANMALLRDAALDAGARTVFSATEAANAIEELGKAGVSTTDILNGGLDAALDLAAAGGIGVAEAAGIAATALKTFKLEGSDMAHVADLLAAGAGKAMGDVTDLSAALNQSALVANSTGLSIDETTAALAAFASQGLLGSDAGTSFKTMLGALTPNSVKAADEMERLGISAYDAQGNFVGLEKFAGNLKTSMSGLTDEQRSASLEIMFGSDAVRAATVLYDEGAEGIAEWSEAVDDTGYAAETAAMRLDNLKGDVEALGGAFDTALIKSGSAADGVMRFLVQAATELIDVFNEAPLFVQQTALAIVAVAAAASLAGGAFLLGVPKIAEFTAALAVLTTSQIPAVASAALAGQTAITNMGKGAAATAKFMTGPWGIAMLTAGIGVKLLIDHLESLRSTSGEMENALITASKAATILKSATKGQEWTSFRDMGAVMSNLSGELDKIANQSENFFSTFGDYGIQASKNSLNKIGEDLAKLAAKDLPAAQRAFGLLADETDGSDRQMNALLDSMGPFRNALLEQASAQEINIEGLSHAEQNTKLLAIAQRDSRGTALDTADAYLETAGEAEGLTEKLDELIGLINEANGVGQDAVSSNAAFQESLAGITESVEAQKEAFIKLQEDAWLTSHETLDGFKGTLDGFTLSLDESTASGSANAAMLSGVATDAQAAALAQYELDKRTMGGKEATDKYIATLATSKKSLEDQAIANGFTAEEVQNLSDKVFALPTQREIDILADTASAKNTIDDFMREYGTRSGTIIYRAQLPDLNGTVSGSGRMGSFDTGGFTGFGGKYEPAGIVHRREFVSTAETTANPDNRRALEFMHRGGVIRGYADGGYVDGRNIQYASSGSHGATSVSVAPSVSLAGATIVMSVDGRQMTAVIQDQIVAADQSNARAISRGRQAL